MNKKVAGDPLGQDGGEDRRHPAAAGDQQLQGGDQGSGGEGGHFLLQLFPILTRILGGHAEGEARAGPAEAEGDGEDGAAE